MTMGQVMTHMKMKAKQFEGLIENLKTELETLRVQYIEMTIEWAKNDFNRLIKMKRNVSEFTHLRNYAHEVHHEGGRHEKVCSQYSNSIKALGTVITMNGREYDMDGMTRTRNHRGYHAFLIDCALDLGIIGVLKFWVSRGVDGMTLVSYDSALDIDSQSHINELNGAIQKYQDESEGYQGRTNKFKHLNGSYTSMSGLVADVENAHVEWFVDNAEKHFASSIEKLAIRLFDKKLDFGNLSFDTSHIDANISTTISDGDKSVKAWTIIASGSVQRPHYRYLIK